MLILLSIVFLTLFISANCSLYEAVLYSTRMGTLEAAKKRKDKRSKLATLFIQLKKNISTPIAAILITNTLANTTGATIAGIYASKVLSPAALPIFSLLFTLGILLLSEILPKNIGAVHWRILWPWIVHLIRLLNLVLSPLIFLTEKFSQLFIKGYKAATITEDEILAMVHVGAREGEITQAESRMVHSMIELENKTVHEVMTPRNVMSAKDINSSLHDFLRPGNEKVFTRQPVWADNSENILGYVNIKDIIAKISDKENNVDLSSYIRPISFIPDSMNCLTLLTNFLKHRKHIAMVVDDYESISGIITLEDLIEAVIGREIVDETDKTVDLQKTARETQHKRGI